MKSPCNFCYCRRMALSNSFRKLDYKYLAVLWETIAHLVAWHSQNKKQWTEICLSRSSVQMTTWLKVRPWRRKSENLKLDMVPPLQYQILLKGRLKSVFQQQWQVRLPGAAIQLSSEYLSKPENFCKMRISEERNVWKSVLTNLVQGH